MSYRGVFFPTAFNKLTLSLHDSKAQGFTMPNSL